MCDGMCMYECTYVPVVTRWCVSVHACARSACDVTPILSCNVQCKKANVIKDVTQMISAPLHKRNSP